MGSPDLEPSFWPCEDLAPPCIPLPWVQATPLYVVLQTWKAHPALLFSSPGKSKCSGLLETLGIPVPAATLPSCSVFKDGTHGLGHFRVHHGSLGVCILLCGLQGSSVSQSQLHEPPLPTPPSLAPPLCHFLCGADRAPPRWPRGWRGGLQADRTSPSQRS